MLVIQNKRFYLDVKQNHRGRFIKVAEVGFERDDKFDSFIIIYFVRWAIIAPRIDCYCQ